jgi:hypothetical protein
MEIKQEITGSSVEANAGSVLQPRLRKSPSCSGSVGAGAAPGAGTGAPSRCASDAAAGMKLNIPQREKRMPTGGSWPYSRVSARRNCDDAIDRLGRRRRAQPKPDFPRPLRIRSADDVSHC